VPPSRRRLVDGEHHVRLDDPHAIHPDRIHELAPAGVHEVIDIRAVLEDRHQRRVREREQEHVGLVAWRQHAELRLVDRACPHPRRHPQRLVVEIGVGSSAVAFASSGAKRSSSQRLRLLLVAAPSVPSPIWTPPASSAATGAIPAPSLGLLCGQWATPTWWRW
jgi:hypothetical protein